MARRKPVVVLAKGHVKGSRRISHLLTSDGWKDNGDVKEEIDGGRDYILFDGTEITEIVVKNEKNGTWSLTTVRDGSKLNNIKALHTTVVK